MYRFADIMADSNTKESSFTDIFSGDDNSFSLKESDRDKIISELERYEHYTYGQLLDAILRGMGVKNSLSKEVVDTAKSQIKATVRDNMPLLNKIYCAISIVNGIVSSFDHMKSEAVGNVPVLKPMMNQVVNNRSMNVNSFGGVNNSIDIKSIAFAAFVMYLEEKKIPIQKLTQRQFVKNFALFAKNAGKDSGAFTRILDTDSETLYKEFYIFYRNYR